MELNTDRAVSGWEMTCHPRKFRAEIPAMSWLWRAIHASSKGAHENYCETQVSRREFCITLRLKMLWPKLFRILEVLRRELRSERAFFQPNRSIRIANEKIRDFFISK